MCNGTFIHSNDLEYHTYRKNTSHKYSNISLSAIRHHIGICVNRRVFSHVYRQRRADTSIKHETDFPFSAFDNDNSTLQLCFWRQKNRQSTHCRARGLGSDKLLETPPLREAYTRKLRKKGIGRRVERLVLNKVRATGGENCPRWRLSTTDIRQTKQYGC